MDWALPDGRSSHATARCSPISSGSERTPSGTRWPARPATGHYGLGDKTGPLDLTGRRLRCAMRDALGFDPERGDPLYKNWPFLIVRDGASGSRTASSTTTAPRACSTSAASTTTISAAIALRGRGRRPRPLSDPRAAPHGRHPQIRRADRAHGAAAALVARLRADRHGARRRADAQARIEGVIDAAKAHDVPISAFHFGSGYTSIGQETLRLHLEPRQIPGPEGADARLRRRGHEGRRQPEAVPARRPSPLRRGRRGRRLRRRRRRRAARSRSSGTARARMSTSPTPPASPGGRRMSRGRFSAPESTPAWNDNNEYGLLDDEATCAGFGQPAPLAILRPVQALLMTRATREAQLAAKPDVRPFTVTRAGGPACSATPRPGAATTQRAGSSSKEFSHRPRNVALGDVQHRPRRRRLSRGRRPARSC